MIDMRRLGIWPKVAIVAIVFAVLGGVGAALWVKRQQQTATAETMPNAARVERVDGQVGINNSLNDETSNDWIEATPNMPISAGDRIFTRDNSRASIAFTGRNFARLDDGTALDVLALSDDRTQLALRDGSALFDVGYLPSGGLFEVGTPYGAVDFNRPGLYELGINDNGSVWVSVLSGLAQVAGLAGSGEISQGEMLTLLGQTAANVALSRFEPSYAGGLIDDYYGYRYPNLYDGRYRDYNAYVNDPYYYDPYRRYQSYQYVNYGIPGIYDLDPYGDWMNVSSYGYGWRPRVDSGWAPYQSGYWYNDYPHGLTWVSSEPWGYAPYHYGRWAFVDGAWYWIPDSTSSQVNYSPALVAFLPLANNGVGWLPLGPGDPYAGRYYDEYWQPHYYSQVNLRPAQLINLNVPGAIAVVPWNDFNSYLDRNRIRHGDWRSLGSVQPILEPLLDTPLRNAALRSAWGRGKIDIPPGIAKRLDTPVITVAEVRDLPGRRDIAKRLRVERINDDARKSKIDFRNQQAPQQGASQGAQGVERGRQDVRQVPHNQRGAVTERPEQRQRPDQAQGERVGSDRREAGRPQADRPQQRQQIQRSRGGASGKREAQPRVQFMGPPAPARQSAPPARERKPQVERQQQRPQPQVQRSQPQVQRAQQQVQRAQQQVQRAQPKVQHQAQQSQRAQPQAQKPQRAERPAKSGSNEQAQKGGKKEKP